MILVVAVVIGLAAGIIRARITQRPYQPPSLKFIGLVLVALLAQWIVLGFHPTRVIVPDLYASLVLVLSQLALLAFVWVNRKTSGFWLLGAGLLLNLAVILLNGGWMPISPDTVRWLAPNAAPDAWQIGERLAFGKDKVLLVENTRLWFFSDRLRAPDWLSYRFAFSLGDVVIALGAVWLLWSAGGRKHTNE
jgi:hypothetical protein